MRDDMVDIDQLHSGPASPGRALQPQGNRPASGHALFTVRQDGRIVRWSRGAAQLFGYDAEEVLGKSHAFLYEEPDGAIGAEHLLEAARKNGRYEANVRGTRKDRSPFQARLLIEDLGGGEEDAELAIIVCDVTAWQETECCLAFYHAILDSALDAIAIIDRDARYVEQNTAHRTLLRYSDEDLMGQTPLLHTDEATYQRVMTALAGSGRFEGEVVSTRKDGIPVEIEMKVFPITDDSGRALYYIGIKRDITDRKRAERAQRESEARLKAVTNRLAEQARLLDLSYDAIIMCDLTDRILYWNQGATRMFGWTQQEALGRIRGELLETSFPGALEEIQEAFHRDGRWEGELVQQRRDGTPLTTWTRWVLDRDDAGRPAAVLVTKTDITRRKEAEEALQRRETQLRVITDGVSGLISYVDREERYRFVNAGYEHTFGLTRQHIVGRTARELLGATYADVAPYIKRVLAGEQVLFESDVVYAGVPRTVQVSYKPDVAPDGTVAGFYVLVTDISDRKRQETELRRWKDELEHRVAERTQALLASQERLRALASQLSITEQRERRKLAADLHDYLAQLLVVGGMKIDQARKSGTGAAPEVLLKDLREIFQQALTYTRTMIGELNPRALHEAGLAAALEWLGRQMQKHGLWVTVEANCGVVTLPEDHAVLVYQSVRELLFNVLKHAQVDRATVSLQVTDEGLVLAVVDRGKGMDADAIARGAEPGHFGLLAVRERMEAMGGWLRVESAPGAGTRVELGLPRSAASAQASKGV